MLSKKRLVKGLYLEVAAWKRIHEESSKEHESAQARAERQSASKPASLPASQPATGSSKLWLSMMRSWSTPPGRSIWQRLQWARPWF